jgi:hypothetical protein
MTIGISCLFLGTPTSSLASGSSCHKLKLEGSLEHYKACWVLCGFSQEQGVDFDEMFSPVVKSAMVRIILSIALSLKWETCQLDGKLAKVHRLH